MLYIIQYTRSIKDLRMNNHTHVHMDMVKSWNTHFYGFYGQFQGWGYVYWNAKIRWNDWLNMKTNHQLTSRKRWKYWGQRLVEWYVLWPLCWKNKASLFSPTFLHLFYLPLKCGSTSEQVRITLKPSTTSPPSAHTCPPAMRASVSNLSVWHTGCDLRASLS